MPDKKELCEICQEPASYRMIWYREEAKQSGIVLKKADREFIVCENENHMWQGITKIDKGLPEEIRDIEYDHRCYSLLRDLKFRNPL